MSSASVKSVRKGKQAQESEKNSIRERLQCIKKDRDTIVKIVDGYVRQASDAANLLLLENRRTKFMEKYPVCFATVNQCYLKLVDILDRLTPGDEEDDDEDSQCSEGELTDITSSSCADLTAASLQHNDSVIIHDAQNSIVTPSVKDSLILVNSANYSDYSKAAGDHKDDDKTGKPEITYAKFCSEMQRESPNKADVVKRYLDGANVIAEIGEEDELALNTSLDTLKEEIDIGRDYTELETCRAKPLVMYDVSESVSSEESKKLSGKNEDVADKYESPKKERETAGGLAKEIFVAVVKENEVIESPSISLSQGPSISTESLCNGNQITVKRLELQPDKPVEVMVMQVTSPFDFWVQVLGDDLGLRLMASRHCNGPDAKKLGKDLQVGLHCFAWDTMDDSWCRAVVTRIQYRPIENSLVMCPSYVANSVDIRHLDVGTVNTLHPDQLKQMTEECAAIPARALHCRLARVVPYGEWSANTLSFFQDLVSEETFNLTFVNYAPEDLALVELQSDTIPNVSDHLVKKNMAIFEDPLGTKIPTQEKDNKIGAKGLAETRFRNGIATEKNEKIVKTEKTAAVIQNGLDYSTQSLCPKPVSTKREEHFLSNSVSSLTLTDSYVSIPKHPPIACFTKNGIIPNAILPSESPFLILVEHLDSPTSFYAQVVNDKCNSEYNEVVEKLEHLSPDYDNFVKAPLVSLLRPKSCWAVRFSNDGKWYRGQIMDEMVQDDRVRIKFVDFGNTEWVKVSDLRPLMIQLCQIPALVIHCSAANISPHALPWDHYYKPCEDWVWSEDSVKKFEEMTVDGLEAVIAEKDEKIITSTLRLILMKRIDEHEKFCLNEEMVACHLADSNLYVCNNYSESEDGETDSELQKLNEMTIGNDEETEDAGYAATGYVSRDEKRICISFNRGRCRNPYCRYEHIRQDSPTLDQLPTFADGPQQVEFLKPGQTVCVSVESVFNPGHFYVILPFGIPNNEDDTDDESVAMSVDSEQETLNSLMKKLDKHYSRKVNKNPNIIFHEGEIVVAKYENIWYRGKVSEENIDMKKTQQVFFLDYGNTEIVPKSNIFPMEIEFMHLPFQAVECFLYNVEPVGRKRNLTWNKSSRDWFDEKVYQKVLYATIISKSSYCIYIELKTKERLSINEQLVKKGFATKVAVKKSKHSVNQILGNCPE